MAATGLEGQDMTANEMTAELLDQIPKRFAARVWRNNRVKAMAVGQGGKLRMVSAGIDGQGDITGIICLKQLGVRIELEIKAGKDRQTPVQEAFQRMIENHGGIYILVRDPAEAINQIANKLFSLADGLRK